MFAVSRKLVDIEGTGTKFLVSREHLSSYVPEPEPEPTGYSVYVSDSYTGSSYAQFSFDGGSTVAYNGSQLEKYTGEKVASDLQNGDLVVSNSNTTSWGVYLYYHYVNESSRSHSKWIEPQDSRTIELTADVYIDETMEEKV